jgi:hypothetical protein
MLPTRIYPMLLLLCRWLHAQAPIVSSAGFRGDEPVAAGSWLEAVGIFPEVSMTAATRSTPPLSGLNPETPGLWQIGRVPTQVFGNIVNSNEVMNFV